MLLACTVLLVSIICFTISVCLLRKHFFHDKCYLKLTDVFKYNMKKIFTSFLNKSSQGVDQMNYNSEYVCQRQRSPQIKNIFNKQGASDNVSDTIPLLMDSDIDQDKSLNLSNDQEDKILFYSINEKYQIDNELQNTNRDALQLIKLKHNCHKDLNKTPFYKDLKPFFNINSFNHDNINYKQESFACNNAPKTSDCIKVIEKWLNYLNDLKTVNNDVNTDSSLEFSTKFSPSFMNQELTTFDKDTAEWNQETPYVEREIDLKRKRDHASSLAQTVSGTYPMDTNEDQLYCCLDNVNRLNSKQFGIEQNIISENIRNINSLLELPKLNRIISNNDYNSVQDSNYQNRFQVRTEYEAASLLDSFLSNRAGRPV